MNADWLWLGVGLAGQTFFFSRFLVQWLASEKAGRSIFPMAFWYLSLSGGFLLLAYAVYREDPVFIVGQSTGPAVHFGYRRRDGNEAYDAAAWLSQREERRLLLPGAMLETCFEPTQLQELGFAHRQRWFLASNASVLPGCRMDAAQTPSNVIHYHPARHPGDGGNGDAAIRSARRPRETAQ